MFDIQVDLQELEQHVNGMIRKIRHFGSVDIGQELSNWQVQDMHRHRPFTMRYRRAKKARTLIRPHSKYEMDASHRFQMKRRRRRQGFLRWSTRPILRVELEDRLMQRLRDAMSRLLTWK